MARIHTTGFASARFENLTTLALIAIAFSRRRSPDVALSCFFLDSSSGPFHAGTVRTNMSRRHRKARCNPLTLPDRYSTLAFAERIRPDAAETPG